jgi:PAS domain-containing protein
MKDQKIILESLINYCSQAFVFCDLEGKILLANPSAYKLYDYNDGELFNLKLKKIVDEFLSDDDLNNAKADGKTIFFINDCAFDDFAKNLTNKDYYKKKELGNKKKFARSSQIKKYYLIIL